MTTFRRRKNKWQAIVRHKDIGVVAKTFQSKTLAVKWASEEHERIVHNSSSSLEIAKVNLGQLLLRYSREVTVLKKGAVTEKRRLNRLINDPINTLTLDKLSSSAIAAFRDRRLPDGARTTHYDLALIRHCLKIATHEWGLMLSSNPVELIKMPPISKPRQRRLNKGEYERLEQASHLTLNSHIWPIVVFAIETGMRRSEILGLTWNNISLERQLACLPLTKNGTSREVPLSIKAVQVLSNQRSRQDTPTPFPVNTNAFRLAWERLRKRADLCDLKFHDLRHEAISRFFEMGLSIPEVAVISGHKDARMLFRYTHLRAEDLVKKIN
ncbi:site-specific integrase [Alphaproteobacteria bacterium]|nr:site-specific integrase [Alphaproteobacteria bacterium]